MPHLYRFADRIGALLAGLLFAFSAYLVLPALMFLIGWEVFQRFYLEEPLAWSYEVAGLMLMSVLLGALPAVSREQAHLRVDLLLSRFPGTLQSLVRAIAHLCTIAVFALLAWRFWQMMLEMQEFEDRALHSDLPLWPFGFYASCAAAVCALAVALRLPMDLAGTERD